MQCCSYSVVTIHGAYIVSIIIIIIIIISFMQGIYTYIPETNYSVVTISSAYIVSFSVESIVLLH